MNTTLNKIRSKSPCADGWVKLLKHLGKPQADDEPLSLITILDSNGLNDAIWCLKAVDGCDREIRLYAVWCARQVQHLMTDKRSIDALDVSERFAIGLATDSELNAARAAASAAARAAASATWDATWDAASAVASAVASAAARNATWDAARAAARATWDAARDAARAAAMDAARDAARDATWDAARDAARAAQEKHLREVCKEIDAAIAQQKEKNT